MTEFMHVHGQLNMRELIICRFIKEECIELTSNESIANMAKQEYVN